MITPTTDTANRKKRRTIPIGEKFVLFDSAEECAKAAAPVFQEQRWRWSHLSTYPAEHNILDTLLMLKEEVNETGRIETGRLIYFEGKFGYQRPKVKS